VRRRRIVASRGTRVIRGQPRGYQASASPGRPRVWAAALGLPPIEGALLGASVRGHLTVAPAPGARGRVDIGADEAGSAVPTIGGATVAGITQTTATITAQVTPNGVGTGVRVEVGKTTAYSASSPTVDAGAGFGPATVSIPVSGLAAATAYHYRVVSTNGSVAGDDGTSPRRRGPTPTGTGSARTPTATTATRPSTPGGGGRGQRRGRELRRRRGAAPGQRRRRLLVQRRLQRRRRFDPSWGDGPPGDGVDQDCSGADARYPRITAPIQYEFSPGRRSTRVVELVVKDVPAGATVEVRCTGRGCFKGVKRVRSTKAGTKVDVRQRFLRNRRLRAGARLEVRVAARPRSARSPGSPCARARRPRCASYASPRARPSRAPTPDVRRCRPPLPVSLRPASPPDAPPQ
jgi:hypothetical protein